VAFSSFFSPSCLSSSGLSVMSHCSFSLAIFFGLCGPLWLVANYSRSVLGPPLFWALKVCFFFWTGGVSAAGNGFYPLLGRPLLDLSFCAFVFFFFSSLFGFKSQVFFEKAFLFSPVNGDFPQMCHATPPPPTPHAFSFSPEMGPVSFVQWLTVLFLCEDLCPGFFRE